MTIIGLPGDRWLAFIPGIGTIQGSGRDEVLREAARRRARAA